jgi:hypothetical protein
MAISSDSLRRLAALRLSPEAMAEVLAIIADACDEAGAIETRSKAAIRQANYRARKAGEHNETVTRDVTRVTLCDVTGLPPKKEIPPTPPKEKITPLSPTSLRSVGGAPAKPTPRKILETVLSPEMAAGVVEHRAKLKKPMTALAAEGVARDLTATGSPDEAARLMIERGWLTVKADWWANAQRPTQRAGPRGSGNRAAELLQKIEGRHERNFDPFGGTPDNAGPPAWDADFPSVQRVGGGAWGEGRLLDLAAAGPECL